MDSRNYEEIIGADPEASIDLSGLSDDDRAAAEAFREEMLALDAKISKALAIDVPELTLPEFPAADKAADEARDNVVEMPKRDKPSLGVPAWMGIAASFALLALVGTQFLGGQTDDSALATELLAHLDHEPQALRPSSIPVSDRDLKRVVSTGGAELDETVGVVTYARSCEINGNTVPHLVIQGKLGPITVLLMPDESVSSAIPVEGNGVNGVILPVGDGSIAIIGDRDENLDDIEQQVIDSVSWTI